MKQNKVLTDLKWVANYFGRVLQTFAVEFSSDVVDVPFIKERIAERRIGCSDPVAGPKFNTAIAPGTHERRDAPADGPVVPLVGDILRQRVMERNGE